MRKVVLLMLTALSVASCQRTPEGTGPQYLDKPLTAIKPVYHFAIHPLFNPQKLHQAYQPLMEYLNREIPSATFELEASRDYAEFNRKVRENGPDLLLPNPWQTLLGVKSGYHVIAMAGEPKDFKGLMLVRRDADFMHPKDLKGMTIAYPAPTALAACMMPQWFFHQQGLDPINDATCLYVGSQESAIMSVLMGQAQVGVTWPPPWRLFQKEHPEEAKQLRIAWETPSLVNNSVMVRNDLPKELLDKIITCLDKLDESAEGRQILQNMETMRFIPAANKDYNTVADFIEMFEHEVRKVEQL